MTETEQEERAVRWAAWLREQLALREWRQADMVRESHKHIKADRVSKWLNGKEAPTYRSVLIVANTLGVDRAIALDAAGFEMKLPEDPRELSDDLRDSFDRHSARKINVYLEATRSLALADFTDVELAEEILRRAEGRAEDGDTGVDVSGATEAMSDEELRFVDLSEYELAASNDDTSIDPSRGEA